MVIDPTTLNSSVMGANQAALATRKTSLDAAARKRRDILTQLKQATAGKFNPLLISKLRGNLATATKQVGAVQKTYNNYYGGTFRPYQDTYQQFGALDKANPTMDGVLNQLTPFDPQAASDRLGAQSQLNQQLLASKTGRDELATDYAQGQQQLNQQQPDRYRAILNNFAGRGLANSSGYASAYGNEAADFADRKTDLDTQNQRGLAQYGMADSGAQSDYLSNIASIIAGTTGRLAGDAGQLGLAGNKNLPLLLELARRRLTTAGA